MDMLTLGLIIGPIIFMLGFLLGPLSGDFDNSDLRFFGSMILGIVGGVIFLVSMIVYPVRALERQACEAYNDRTEVEFEWIDFSSWSWGCYTEADGVLISYDQYRGVRE